MVLGPAGSRPALYAPLCLLFGRIPGNSAPGTTNLWNSSHNKLGGRKAHTSLSSADMHTVSCRFSLCAVELPASCAGAAVRAPASHIDVKLMELAESEQEREQKKGREESKDGDPSLIISQENEQAEQALMPSC